MANNLLNLPHFSLVTEYGPTNACPSNKLPKKKPACRYDFFFFFRYDILFVLSAVCAQIGMIHMCVPDFI